jgi:hypothetical protein
LPRAPGLSSIVTVNSFAFGMRLDSLPFQDTGNRRRVLCQTSARNMSEFLFESAEDSTARFGLCQGSCVSKQDESRRTRPASPIETFYPAEKNLIRISSAPLIGIWLSFCSALDRPTFRLSLSKCAEDRTCPGDFIRSARRRRISWSSCRGREIRRLDQTRTRSYARF